MTNTTRHVTEAEHARTCEALDLARELKEADTSRMTLAEKIEHQQAIKQLMRQARGK